MLQTLSELQLTALLQHNAIWLAVEPRLCWVLDQCCTGQLEGGPGTAKDVAESLGLVLPPRPELQASGCDPSVSVLSTVACAVAWV